MLCLFYKTISKVRFQITGLWISCKKGKCFDFNHSLRSLPYFIYQNQTSRLSLLFQVADFLSLFIFVSCFDPGFRITGLCISFKKWECLDLNHSLTSLLYFTILHISIRLLRRVYHFSLLICYPYSLLFHALMLIALLIHQILW